MRPFGFSHGFGLATKIQEFEISRDGLQSNLLVFNVGVEIGQLLALAAILIVMGFRRRTSSFLRHAYTTSVAMMAAGLMRMATVACREAARSSVGGRNIAPGYSTDPVHKAASTRSDRHCHQVSRHCGHALTTSSAPSGRGNTRCARGLGRPIKLCDQ